MSNGTGNRAEKGGIFMNLSLRTIRLCERKFGKGGFWGFDPAEEADFDALTQEDAGEELDTLLEGGLAELVNDEIRFSALGHHIFNMMTRPEQFLCLSNEADRICVRIYIRNAYYLFLGEDRMVAAHEDRGRFTLELLPNLDQVIGSFVYALRRKHSADGEAASSTPEFTVEGRDFDSEGVVLSELTVFGRYEGDDVSMSLKKTDETEAAVFREADCDISALINSVTSWLFERFAKSYEREGS